MSKKSPNLDNLMLSYADLNKPSTSKGFKGPSLKDVVVKPKEKPSFRSSTKAANWSCLEQTLEDAFSDPSHQQQSQSLNHNLFQNQQQNLPSNNDDEWGDFASLPATTVSNNMNPIISSMNSVITPNSNVTPTLTPMNHPTISNFNNPLFPPIMNHQSEQTNPIINPISSSNPPNEDIDDEFGDFISARPTLQNSTSFVPPPSNYQINSENTTAETPSETNVGCRLATFEQESPIHHFKTSPLKPQQPVEEEEEEEDDFGDFTDIPKTNSVVATTSTILPPPPFQQHQHQQPLNLEQNLTLTSSSIQSMLNPLPSAALIIDTNKSHTTSNTSNNIIQANTLPTNSGVDKYSALRDIFNIDSNDEPINEELVTKNVEEDDDDDEFGDFVEPVKAPNHKINNLDFFGPSPEPMIPTTKPNEINFVSNMMFSTPPIIPCQSPSLPQINNSINDDLLSLDIIGNGGNLPPLLSLNANEQGLINTFEAEFKDEVKPEVKPTPWISQSPPPPPDTIHDSKEDEFQDFAFPSSSSIKSEDEDDDDITELNLGSLNLTDLKPSPEFLEIIQENKVVLNNHSPETAINNNNNNSAPLEEIPHSKKDFNDVNDDTIKIQDKVTNYDVKEIWFKVLSVASELMSQAEDAFNSLIDPEILNAILEDDKGNSYVKNIIEIYRVALRIQTSYNVSSSKSDKMNIKLEEIDKSWQSFATHIRTSNLMPSNSCLSFTGGNDVSKEVEKSSSCCCICRVDVKSNPIDLLMNDAITKYKGYSYHSACANLWLNLIQPDLPSH